MNKYKVIYNGKEYIYMAKCASDAIEKLSNRKVYGNRLFFDYKLNMISADDLGVEWAEAWTTGDNNPKRIIATIIR